MARSDPFIEPLPPKLANDPELGPFFTRLMKNLQDLYIQTGASGVSSVSYTAHASGATPVTSNAATDLDTTAAAVESLATQFNALVAGLKGE